MLFGAFSVILIVIMADVSVIFSSVVIAVNVTFALLRL